MQIPSEQFRKVDTAIARTFVYRFLAQAYEYPTAEAWQWLSTPEIEAALLSSAKAIVTDDCSLLRRAGEWVAQLTPDKLDEFTSDYIGAFGHAARGSCPLNEIEYGDLKADPLFQPHRLADLAAFYRAFGLEVTDDAPERQDHICLELEFMSVLAAKEAYALENQLEPGQSELCREAQKAFLHEHLGRWTPGFTRRLARAAGDGPLGALAQFTLDFVIGDCQRFGVTPGSEDLLLRPVDESSESLCAACGLNHLPPGALAATPQL
jgi:DMSO reductase family type II enzyme chaperone